MERFIAVDAGKYATKVAEYDPKTKTVRTFKLRTCVSEGDFRDDAIEKNTVVVEINGQTYKVGNGARGSGVDLDTNKMTEDHKICLLTAVAAIASDNEKDIINIATGLPAKDWASVSKREDFKEYMFPNGDVTISIKNNSSSPIHKKTFTIKTVQRADEQVKNCFAFAESAGALFMDGIVETLSPTSLVAVIDMGNLNLNATFWQGRELVQDKSTTAELGGAILIQEIAQEISTRVTYCDDMLAATILKERNNSADFLEPYNLSEEQKKEIYSIVEKARRDHVQKIKRVCKARNWPLELIKIVAIGGTCEDLEDILKEEFNNIVVVEDATFCNVLGYLRMMCIKENVLNELIPLDKKSTSKPQPKTENTEVKAEKAS